MTTLDRRDEQAVLEQARLDATRAFTAHTPPARGAIWWASVIALIAVGTIAGAFVYSYFYLRLGADQWPLPGSELRPIGGPLLAVGLLALALAVGRVAARGRVRALLTAVGLVAVLVIQASALADSGYRIGANAYEALVVTLEAVAALVLAVALVVRAGAVLVGWPPTGSDALHDADTVLVAGSSLLWIVLWGVIHLAPRVI